MDTSPPRHARRRPRTTTLLATAAAILPALLAAPAAHAEYATPTPPLDTPPQLRLPSTAVRATGNQPHVLRLPIIVDEPVRLDVSARGRAGAVRTIEFARRAGRTVLEIPLHRRSALTRAFDRGQPTPVRLQVLATDADGEHDVLATTVRVLPPRTWVPSTRLLSPMPGFAITSGYGPRWGRLHKGVDIPAPVGTRIRAARAGVVTRVGHDGAYGLATVIDHGPYATFYAHQRGTNVRPGQRVERGQVIGTVGMTGRTTGAHLHFEVHVDGTPRNPRRYLR